MAKAKRKRGGPRTQAQIDKARRNRASRIRLKLTAGKEVSDEDRAFLAGYDAEPHGNKLPDQPAEEAPGGESADDDEGDEDDAQVDDVVPPIEARPVEAMKAPPPPAEHIEMVPGLPPVPKLDFTADAAKEAKGKARAAGEKWQDKYSGGVEGGSGREATCVYLASLWDGALGQMLDAIKEGGGEPLVDRDKLRPILVLAVDEIAPKDLVITPTIYAATATSATIVQRFTHAKRINDARAAKKLAESSSSRPMGVVVPIRPDVKPEPPPAAPEPGPPAERAPIAPPVPASSPAPTPPPPPSSAPRASSPPNASPPKPDGLL